MKIYRIKLKIRAIDSTESKIEDSESEDCHIFVAGKVDEQKVNLVVDTGASHSCFDSGFISQLYSSEEFEEGTGINAGVGCNNLQAKITTLKELKIGRFILKDYSVVLLDLSHVNTVYKMAKNPLIQGIIGSDLLKRYGAVIDFKRAVMTLEEEKS
jgi:hypothetical protein